VKIPTGRTLDKYGMMRLHFMYLWQTQNGMCGVCEKDLNTGRVFIDHEHCKGFASMTAKEKRGCVRGLLCFVCNKYRVAKNTEYTARNILRYLTARPVLDA
jgi:hypothetical protein